jgi:hypothetical protein
VSVAANPKADRDRRIVADRAAGLTWATVAARNGLAERQCRNIVAKHREEQPPPWEHDPLEVLQEQLEQLDALVERLALVAEESGHDAVRLGALKSQLIALQQRRELLQATGLLPRILGLIGQEIDMRRMTDDAVRVLKQHDVSQELADDLVAAFRSHSVWHGRIAASINGSAA